VSYVFIFREIRHLYRQNTTNMSGVEIVHQMSPVSRENGVKLTIKYAAVHVI